MNRINLFNGFLIIKKKKTIATKVNDYNDIFLVRFQSQSPLLSLNHLAFKKKNEMKKRKSLNKFQTEE